MIIYYPKKIKIKIVLGNLKKEFLLCNIKNKKKKLEIRTNHKINKLIINKMALNNNKRQLFSKQISNQIIQTSYNFKRL